MYPSKKKIALIAILLSVFSYNSAFAYGNIVGLGVQYDRTPLGANVETPVTYTVSFIADYAGLSWLDGAGSFRIETPLGNSPCQSRSQYTDHSLHSLVWVQSTAHSAFTPHIVSYNSQFCTFGNVDYSTGDTFSAHLAQPFSTVLATTFVSSAVATVTSWSLNSLPLALTFVVGIALILWIIRKLKTFIRY
jgi:hypothetical protein